MDMRWMVAVVLGGFLAWGTPAGVRSAPAQGMAASTQAESEDDEMVREMMVLSISRESAASYADLMGLDDLQRDIAMELHREYHDKYRNAALTMRDARVAIEAKMAGGEADMADIEATMRDMMRVMLGFLDRVMALGQNYIDDLGTLAASEAQQAGHQRVVRAREREMAVAMSSMQGGGEGGVIDLIALGRQIEPPLLPAEGEDTAAQALMEYERELGGLCGPFVQRVVAAFRDMAENFSIHGEDPSRDQALEAEMEAMVRQFSAINERAVRRVAAALPEARRAQWDLAYKRARWPQVYAPNHMHRTHDAALALSDLTADQREIIEAALVQYTREAEPANKKWIDAIAEAEAARNQMRHEWNEQLWAAFQALDQAAKNAQSARETLDNRFAERVLGALTPEQRKSMPATRSGVDADAVIQQLGGG